MTDQFDQPDAPEPEPNRPEPNQPEPKTASDTPVADEPGLVQPKSGRRRAPLLGRARRKASRFELPILIVVAITIAIVLKSFVVQPFYIPSASMEKTLHGCQGCSGDRILVFKPVYHVRDPHPGDVVVFKAPLAWNEGSGTVLSGNPIIHAAQWAGQLVGIVAPSERDLVKRVIATAGQTVKCCDAAGNVQVSDDGKTFRSLNEPYVFENDELTFGPVRVPSGRLWVMGDHRGNSADSRYHCVADSESADPAARANCDPVSSTVAIADVIGKSVAIAWPPSRWRTLGTPATFSALGLPGPIGIVTQPATAAFSLVALAGFGRRRRRRSGRGRAVDSSQRTAEARRARRR